MHASKCATLIESGSLAATGSLLPHHTSVTSVTTPRVVRREGNRWEPRVAVPADAFQARRRGVLSLGAPRRTKPVWNPTPGSDARGGSGAGPVWTDSPRSSARRWLLLL